MLKSKHVLPWSLVALVSAFACGGGDDGGGKGGGGGSAGTGGTHGSSGSPGDASPDNSLGGSDDGGDDASVRDDASTDAPGDGDAEAQAEAGVIELVFTISPGEGRRPISSYIYGTDNGVVAAQANTLLVRAGGENASAYNWEINATNIKDPSGQLNAPLGSGSPGAFPAAAIASAKTKVGMALINIPIGPYVAADSAGDDVMLTPNRLNTRFKQNVAVKGSAFAATPSTSDAFVYQDEFVNWAMKQAGTTPVVFGLDNEPSIWEVAHPAFHLSKASYDDVVGRGITYAKAIKNVWPAAGVSGPVSYGWLEFISLQNSPDFSTKGDFLDYYLAQLAAAGTTAGHRLLDYLDLHWYSEAFGGGVRVIYDDTADDVVKARVQAPRSLWDASYHETSWVQGTLPGGEAIQLLARMRARIARSYPGTKLAVSAWRFGGGGHISGAVAAVDALGIFGREGVDIANLDAFGETPYFVAAFKALRNYDGKGGHFGETSVKAETTDWGTSSVYASVRSDTDAELTIIAINKQTTPRNAKLIISSATKYLQCDVWQLTGLSPALIAGTPLLLGDASNQFEYVMPPMSVTVIVPKS